MRLRGRNNSRCRRDTPRPKPICLAGRLALMGTVSGEVDQLGTCRGNGPSGLLNRICAQSLTHPRSERPVSSRDGGPSPSQRAVVSR